MNAYYSQWDDLDERLDDEEDEVFCDDYDEDDEEDERDCCPKCRNIGNSSCYYCETI